MRIRVLAVGVVAICSFGALTACDKGGASAADAAPPLDAAPATTAAVVDAAPAASATAAVPAHDAHLHPGAKADGGHAAADIPVLPDVCTADLTPKDVAVVRYPGLAETDGTITIDGPTYGPRRFRVRVLRGEGATMNFFFLGYGAGDSKPAAEKLTSKSIVAREVPLGGDHDNVFFDSAVVIPGASKDRFSSSTPCREKVPN